eukprot:m.126742 g.126742  ORF g.126742 m.126742 type:complete len:464 (+) comp11195_c1_seq1:3499-4890(+)
MSIFRSKKGKNPAQEANADVIVGRIEGCPIENSVYDAEWEKFKTKGWPRRVSRLYDNVDGVLRDPHCLRYFVAYLKSQKKTALLKFWSAAEKFAQGNYDGFEVPPDTAPEAAAVLVAQEMYTKFIAENLVGLADDVRAPLVELFGGDTPPTQVDAKVFRPAQKLVHTQLKQEQFSAFILSPQYSQYCISILSSGTVRPEDMLYSEPFRAEFIDWMVRHDWGHLMNFWIIAGEFHSQAIAKGPDGKPKNDAKTLMADAQGIYSRYAGPEAMEPIGFDEEVLSDMDQKLKKGLVNRCFLRALHTVYTAVATHYFPEYLQSPAFQQYLKGLHASANPEARAPKQTEAVSDGEVADAGSALPSDDEAVGDKKKTMVRSHSLGSIDAWGVYIRDEEATNPLFEERRRGRAAGMSYVMKRSVGFKPKTKAEQQAEEELALQQAKDVINSIYGEMAEHKTIDEVLRTRVS